MYVGLNKGNTEYHIFKVPSSQRIKYLITNGKTREWREYSGIHNFIKTGRDDFEVLSPVTSDSHQDIYMNSNLGLFSPDCYFYECLSKLQK